MLQAVELELGTVWVCYFRSDILKEELNIPDNSEPINILVIGYAADKSLGPNRHSKTRQSIAKIVINESF